MSPKHTQFDADGCEFCTIGVILNPEKPVQYTYKCDPAVQVGDFVNVKLPRGVIMKVAVITLHETPQLSDKWETKWAVIVQTREEAAAETPTSSDLAKELGL